MFSLDKLSKAASVHHEAIFAIDEELFPQHILQSSIKRPHAPFSVHPSGAISRAS